jgi:hypothetical protein
VALLTRGIVKFPPGTINRWKMIAEFVGTKTQKDSIKKAQELVERRKEATSKPAATVQASPVETKPKTEKPKSEKQQLRELEQKGKQKEQQNAK